MMMLTMSGLPMLCLTYSAATFCHGSSGLDPQCILVYRYATTWDPHGPDPRADYSRAEVLKPSHPQDIPSRVAVRHTESDHALAGSLSRSPLDLSPGALLALCMAS